MPDRILEKIPAKDMSLPIMVLMYSTVLSTICELWYGGGFCAVERFSFTYAITLLVKAATLYVTHIDIPEGYIGLTDPVSSLLMGRGITYSRDLLFSSHVALLFLCYLNTGTILTYALSVVSLITVPLLLICNHVHYSVDILVAPFVGYCCQSAVLAIHESVG